jgi:hypothetical protein
MNKRDAGLIKSGHNSAGPNRLGWAHACVAMILLGAQNATIFWRHYFNDAGFPWDFVMGYHAVAYYWIESARHGHFPSWIPFQSMGYPMHLDLQSGLFYPPFWTFVLFDQPYTLHAAVIFQCLHVLVGSVGAFFLARVFRLDWSYSLLAGVAYQFFGGFYGNAQHSDIIRGYALVPWFLASLVIGSAPIGSLRRWILPVITTYLMMTGVYPGILIAHLLLGGIFVATQLLMPGEHPPRTRAWLGAQMALSVGIGCGLAAIKFVPYLLEFREVARSNQAGLIQFAYLEPLHLYSLLYPIDRPMFPNDISMRSLFVTAPVLALVAMVSLQRLRALLPLVILFGCALLLSMETMVRAFLVNIVPLLRLSRFPMADYRPSLAVILVILAAMALRDLPRGEAGRFGWVVIRLGSVLVFALLGGLFVNLAADPHSAVVVFVAILWASCGIVMLAHERLLPRATVLVLVLILIAADGFRVQAADSRTWVDPGMTANYRSIFGFDLARLNAMPWNGAVVRASRPPRVDPGHIHSFSWRGYLTGEFLLYGYDPAVQLVRQRRILGNVTNAGQQEGDPSLKAFMAQGSTTLMFPETMAVDLEQIQARARSSGGGMGRGITMLRYDVDQITYQITMDRPGIIVENELYFPGWRGTLHFPDGRVEEVTATGAGDLLRAWQLPSGTYELRTSFVPRNVLLGALISAAFLVLWLVIIAAPLVVTRWRSPHGSVSWPGKPPEER